MYFMSFILKERRLYQRACFYFSFLYSVKCAYKNTSENYKERYKKIVIALKTLNLRLNRIGDFCRCGLLR